MRYENENDCRRYKLDPEPPRSITRIGRTTRLAIEIAENDNGEVKITAFKVKIGRAA